MKWYIPTNHGDIRLEALNDKMVKVTVNNLTPSEKRALESLKKRAKSPPMMKKRWNVIPGGFDFLDKPSLIDKEKGFSFELEAPLMKVQRYLAKELKPGRKLVEVVIFEGGELEDVTDKEKPDSKKEPKAGVTSAAPTQGCPAPDFDHVEHRANEVLETFLSPEQIEDWRKYNRFVSEGADSGHRYMITSRERRDQIGMYAGRSLYDLDEKRAYCVHDWTIPAAEEALNLHLFLSIPGKEEYIRAIPDVGGMS